MGPVTGTILDESHSANGRSIRGIKSFYRCPGYIKVMKHSSNIGIHINKMVESLQ